MEIEPRVGEIEAKVDDGLIIFEQKVKKSPRE